MLSVDIKKAQNPGTFEVWLCPQPASTYPAQALARAWVPLVRGPEYKSRVAISSWLHHPGSRFRDTPLLLRPSQAWPSEPDPATALPFLPLGTPGQLGTGQTLHGWAHEEKEAAAQDPDFQQALCYLACPHLGLPSPGLASSSNAHAQSGWSTCHAQLSATSGKCGSQNLRGSVTTANCHPLGLPSGNRCTGVAIPTSYTINTTLRS